MSAAPLIGRVEFVSPTDRRRTGERTAVLRLRLQALRERARLEERTAQRSEDDLRRAFIRDMLDGLELVLSDCQRLIQGGGDGDRSEEDQHDPARVPRARD